MSKYKRCDSEFRRKVMAEYISGVSTPAQICRKYEISSGMLKKRGSRK